jgi:hypothetical protein
LGAGHWLPSYPYWKYPATSRFWDKKPTDRIDVGFTSCHYPDSKLEGESMTHMLIDTLSNSNQPAIQYAVRLSLEEQDPSSEEMRALQSTISTSPLVKDLLSQVGPDGTIPLHPYSKFDGAHWILAILAELHYPPGDNRLIPLREQELGYFFENKAGNLTHVRRIFYINGLTRACASIEGNALFALLRLGLLDERCERLAHLLLDWQWPDGGWNCDRNPAASHSSFHESLIPMRALNLYAQHTGDPRARQAVTKAAELFLRRSLYRRLKDNSVIDRRFTQLHYPRYWHYDMLFALKVMSEAGLINDPRCADALDLLETKRLPDGGFPAEAKYYNVSQVHQHNCSLINWGGTSKKRMNEWVTVDALAVLKTAGRVTKI